MLSEFDIYSKSLNELPSSNLLITTLNAHSYNVACKDKAFAEALQGSDVLLPDGVSVVWGEHILRRTKSKDERTKIKKIAGEDLFYWEMRRLEQRIKNKWQCNEHPVQTGEQRQETKERAKIFFLGSTEEVLAKIKARAGVEFPNVEVDTYSPPYKAEFIDEDNADMIAAINSVQPDVLFVGMTAPKQEKWAYKIVHSGQLKVDNCHVCCIGAVFDFYAGTVKRSPKWIINIGMEWLYRLVKEPKRMWRRYLIGNVKFIASVVKEKIVMR